MSKPYDAAFRDNALEQQMPKCFGMHTGLSQCVLCEYALTCKQVTHREPIDFGQTQPDQVRSDGSTASYYELPNGATELQHLISHRDMNAQIGEIFRACYRYGIASHSDKLRDAKKIRFYADAEIQRLNAIIEMNK